MKKDTPGHVIVFRLRLNRVMATPSYGPVSTDPAERYGRLQQVEAEERGEGMKSHNTALAEPSSHYQRSRARLAWLGKCEKQR